MRCAGVESPRVRAWRGTDASEGEERFRRAFPEFVRTICGRSDVAAPSEWLLEADIAMADAYGAARWRVEGRFAGVWKELGSGVWKPAPDAPSYLPHLVMLDLPTTPDALRVSESGYGSGELCYVSLRNASRRLVPRSLGPVVGTVEDAENLLVDDLRTARFGDADCTAAVLDASRAEKVSSVEILIGD